MGVAMLGNLFSRLHFQIVGTTYFVHAAVVGVPMKTNQKRETDHRGSLSCHRGQRNTIETISTDNKNFSTLE